MTTQCMETLIYEGWEHDINDQPLESWFNLTGRKLGPSSFRVERNIDNGDR